ncbi:MAG: SDR family NAD(P)-dependent oxidoreductase, partial [Pseudomonadota bacterium]
PVPSAEDFETADLSEMARSFYSECKRVANGRAKAALSWRPAYPTYRDGLAAILAAGG